MKLVKRDILKIVISVSLTLSSCINKNDEDNNRYISENRISANDTIEEKANQNENLLDLAQLKIDLDSFAISVKETQEPFDLRTDTVGENSTDKALWDFKKGIFELINPDSTELLVRHHFSIPNTKRILRLYLLELKFPNTLESESFFKKLINRKDYKADLTGGYYLDFGLTGTTDYVIKIDEAILWFNVSCQYSKVEFNQLIEILRNNMELREAEDVIKCFCQYGCE